METSHRADDNSLFIKHSLTLRDKEKQLNENDLKQNIIENSKEELGGKGNFVLIPYSNETNKTIGTIIENIYKIFDEQAEAIEFLVREDVKFLNRKLKDIYIINDIIIATIVRNDKIIIPSGDDKIELGDRVIIITKRDKLVDINDIVVRGNK